MSTLKVNTIQSNTAGTVTFSEPVAMSSSLTVNGTQTTVEQFTSRSIVDTGTTDASRIAVSNSAVTIAPATSFSSTVTASGLITASAGLTSTSGLTVSSGSTSTQALSCTSLTVGGTNFSATSPALLKAWGSIDITFSATAPHTTITALTLGTNSSGVTAAITNSGVGGTFRLTFTTAQSGTNFIVLFQDNHDSALIANQILPRSATRATTFVDCVVTNPINGANASKIMFMVTQSV
jgi:hypothetical protein